MVFDGHTGVIVFKPADKNRSMAEMVGLVAGAGNGESGCSWNNIPHIVCGFNSCPAGP